MPISLAGKTAIVIGQDIVLDGGQILPERSLGL